MVVVAMVFTTGMEGHGRDGRACNCCTRTDHHHLPDEAHEIVAFEGGQLPPSCLLELHHQALKQSHQRSGSRRAAAHGSQRCPCWPQFGHVPGGEGSWWWRGGVCGFLCGGLGCGCLTGMLQ